ncbi:MAG: beta-N-acetylhexosaminidase [Chlamydiales bacterium]|nr:beta-N-acetylhexosaminidase [Chlamydiales bacterium]
MQRLLCILFILPCFVFSSLKEMTLEEKVGQILMVHFQGEQANEDAKTLIQKIHVGGIIYYNWANGLYGPEQVLELSSGLQTLAEKNRLAVPLFIAVDQEGGLVARLTQGFTIFPGNKALGMTKDPTLAKECAEAMGEELSAVGVNFNLSPVVDVNSNPRNPVIGIRSFGDNAEEVAVFGKEALEGYRKANIITSLKHFPGHGDVEIDSHQDLPVIEKSKEQMQKIELLPFSHLAAHADTIMTAHVLVPSIDPHHCATLSKPLLDILRKEMHFEGVIISDSLVMAGLLKNCPSIDEAAVQALNAGCDIILLGGRQLAGNDTCLELTVADIQRIHQFLVQAVKDGHITETRLDVAVERILALKTKYALRAATPTKEELPLLMRQKEHKVLAEKIAALALKTSNKEAHVASLTNSKIALFAPQMLQNTIKETSLLQLSKKMDILFFTGLSPTQEELQQAETIAKEADALIVCSYNAWKNSSQEKLIQILAKTEKELILIALRDPLDAAICSETAFTITTFSPTAPAIEAAYHQLLKKL